MYLSSTIARKSIVPQSLMRSLHRFLIMVVIAMSGHDSRKAQSCTVELHIENDEKQEREKEGEEDEEVRR